MKIRKASLEDLEMITLIEARCFPEAEAATKEEFEARLKVFPEHFLLLEEEDQVIAFINGILTDEKVIRDEMYEDAALHKEDGDWQTVFGLDTLPEYRRKGYAAHLMNALIDEAKIQGRKGCVLTCKEKLIHYYEKFGYKNYGVSGSTHGGVVWYDMRLQF